LDSVVAVAAAVVVVAAAAAFAGSVGLVRRRHFAVDFVGFAGCLPENFCLIFS
jgi:hypothetical protein